MHFQESILLKRLSKVFVLVFVFLRYRGEGNRRRIKRSTFSKENALVWMRPKIALFTYNKPNHVFQNVSCQTRKANGNTHMNILL